MKQLLILTLLIISCNGVQTNADKTQKGAKPELPKLHLMLSGDSGYILKKTGLHSLLNAAITDNSNAWLYLRANDTIGKFYKVEQTGNYFISVIDLSEKYPFETHLLLEIKPDGTVIKNERYFHHNYACCWLNFYEGFKKIGDFFYFKTCSSGFGNCGSRIHLFKNILPQDIQSSIADTYFSSFDENIEELSSVWELKSNLIVFHYKFEIGKVDEKANYEKKTTELFDVKYLFKNDTWIATDSTKLEKLNNLYK